MSAGRFGRVMTAPATGAAVAQVWQALGSFLLQVAAAWLLGASGLGVISLSLGVIVFAAALASGVVGDSLVILDRHDRVVRGGLVGMAQLIGLASTAAATGGMLGLGVLGPAEAAWFAVALVAFQIEEIVRRALMATMNFWRLVVLDSTALGFSLATMVVWYFIGRVDVGTFLVALAVGQVAGVVAGVMLLAPNERALAPVTIAGLRRVAGFGLMRGVQVSLTPGLLTAARTVVIVLLGQAALGQVEAARIFVAPAMLVVQGLGSYLLSSYVRDRELPAPALVVRARRASVKLLGTAVLAGAMVTPLAPVLGYWVTGPSFTVDQFAVAGWALYIAGSATVQPFSSLAAVLGRQPTVLACRAIDASIALGLVWLVLGPLGLSASFLPFALAAGLFTGGVLVRHFALKPLTNTGVAGTIDDATTARISHVLA